MFLQEYKRGATGGRCGQGHQHQPAELAYVRRAEQALTDENLFRIYIVSNA